MLKHFLKNMLIQIYHQKTKRKDPIQESKKLLTLSRRKEEADQFEHKKKEQKSNQPVCRNGESQKTYGIQRGKRVTQRLQKGCKTYLAKRELSTPLYLYLCSVATPW